MLNFVKAAQSIEENIFIKAYLHTLYYVSDCINLLDID